MAADLEIVLFVCKVGLVCPFNQCHEISLYCLNNNEIVANDCPVSCNFPLKSNDEAGLVTNTDQQLTDRNGFVLA